MRHFIPLLCRAFLFLLAISLIGFAEDPTPMTAEKPQAFSRIGAKDLVLVRVFQEDDLESTLRVAEDGTVTFPLVGRIGVGGKTPQEAAGLLRDALKDGYIRNPQVTVTVVEHFKRRFTVLGQVQKPGAYEIPDTESITLLQAIGMAGGYTNIADPAKIVVKRRNDGKETVYKLNAREMAKGGTSNAFHLHDGDVISVGESWF